MASVPNAYPTPEETFSGSLYGKPTRDLYRAAVKQVVLDVKAAHGLDSEQLAEKIGVGKDTIDNAENGLHSMEALTLLKIAFKFGERAIDPVRNLYLFAPVEEPTLADRCRRIRGELAALEREMAE